MSTHVISSPTTLDLPRPAKLVVTLVGGAVDVLADPHTTGVTVDVRDVSGPQLVVEDSSGALRIEHRKENGQAGPASASPSASPFGGLGQAASKLGLGDAVEKMGLGSVTSMLGAALDRPTARVILTVPEELSVSIRTVSAGVLVGGSHGTVSIHTVSGDVTLDRSTGRADVTTVNGDIESASISGEFNGKTVSGEITVQDAVLRSARLNSVSGRTILDLRHGPSLVSANTVSGDLSIRMPADAGYDASASSTSGHVVVDGEPLLENGKRGGHRSAGDRSVAIKARTVSGNLTVMRRAGAAGPGAGPVIVTTDAPTDVQDEVRGEDAR